MKKYLVYNIDWNCDEEDINSMPISMIIEDKNDLTNDNYELSDFISDEVTKKVKCGHLGCDYMQIMEDEDIKSALSKMELDEILTIYAVETQIDSEHLAMGVEMHQVLDGIILFLCNVWGSNCDYQTIPLDADDTPVEETYQYIIDYFHNTAKNLCGRHKYVLCKSVDYVKD